MSGQSSDNERQRVTTNDNEWQQMTMVQRMPSFCGKNRCITLKYGQLQLECLNKQNAF